MHRHDCGHSDRTGWFRDCRREPISETSPDSGKTRGRFRIQDDIADLALVEDARGADVPRRRTSSSRAIGDGVLLKRIRQVHAASYAAYGSHRAWKALLRDGRGPAFFSVVLDMLSRRVVGWQFASHPRTDLVLDALRMALAGRPRSAASRCSAIESDHESR